MGESCGMPTLWLDHAVSKLTGLKIQAVSPERLNADIHSVVSWGSFFLHTGIRMVSYGLSRMITGWENRK
jgi:hypothetical protein